jgi:hypothetical protein
MTVQHDRELFNLGEAAKRLASQVGVTEPWSGNGSDRFAYFADERRFVIVACRRKAATSTSPSRKG